MKSRPLTAERYAAPARGRRPLNRHVVARTIVDFDLIQTTTGWQPRYSMH